MNNSKTFLKKTVKIVNSSYLARLAGWMSAMTDLESLWLLIPNLESSLSPEVFSAALVVAAAAREAETDV